MSSAQTAGSTQERTGSHRLLVDKVFLVTGGSRGIGKAITIAVKNAGGKVGFTYAQQREEANKVLSQLGDAGTAYQADARELSQMQDVITALTEQFGRFDGIVNNAGIVRDKPLMMMSPDDWRDVLETNLTGTFNGCKAAIVSLMKQRHGRIVNISSVAGVVGMPGQVNYAASKAGIIGLTRSLAREVAKYNITVNSVAPGFIETDMTTGITEKRRQEAQQDIPLGRFGQPEDVAQLVVFLLSDAAGYLTGQTVVLDGGLTL